MYKVNVRVSTTKASPRLPIDLQHPLQLKKSTWTFHKTRDNLFLVETFPVHTGRDCWHWCHELPAAILERCRVHAFSSTLHVPAVQLRCEQLNRLHRLPACRQSSLSDRYLYLGWPNKSELDTGGWVCSTVCNGFKLRMSTTVNHRWMSNSPSLLLKVYSYN